MTAPSIALCLRAAGQAFGIPMVELRRHRRKAPACRARQAAMLMARDAGHSYPKIARELGFKDHTPAFHGVRRAQERRLTNADYDRDYLRACALVTAALSLILSQNPVLP